MDYIKTTDDGGVYWIVEGDNNRSVYLGIADVKRTWFGLSSSVGDSVNIRSSFGGGQVSLSRLESLAKKAWVGDFMIGDLASGLQSIALNVSDQNAWIQDLVKHELSPNGETFLTAAQGGGRSLESIKAEHEYRSQRALAMQPLLLGSNLSAYDDVGAQMAMGNARFLVPPQFAPALFSAESITVLGDPNASKTQKILAGSTLGLIWTGIAYEFGNAILTKSQTVRLQGYVSQAAKEVDAVGLGAFTPAQRAAILRNPNLRPMFRGYQIDRLARSFIGKDPGLKSLMGKVNRGPDFLKSGAWWDMTTKKQWGAHVYKYGPGGRPLWTQ